MSAEFKDRYTVILIGDQLPPTKVAMLTRESSRYGGSLVTGIGGHFEPEKDSSILESAERELSEEVADWEGTELTEFARCEVNRHKALHYFWGVKEGEIPTADEREGTLAWVQVEEMLNQNVFPTTRPVLEEWKSREFSPEKSFTIYVSGQVDSSNITRDVVIDKLEEGLQEI